MSHHSSASRRSSTRLPAPTPVPSSHGAAYTPSCSGAHRSSSPHGSSRAPTAHGSSSRAPTVHATQISHQSSSSHQSVAGSYTSEAYSTTASRSPSSHGSSTVRGAPAPPLALRSQAQSRYESNKTVVPSDSISMAGLNISGSASRSPSQHKSTYSSARSHAPKNTSNSISRISYNPSRAMVPYDRNVVRPYEIQSQVGSHTSSRSGGCSHNNICSQCYPQVHSLHQKNRDKYQIQDIIRSGYCPGIWTCVLKGQTDPNVGVLLTEDALAQISDVFGEELAGAFKVVAEGPRSGLPSRLTVSLMVDFPWEVAFTGDLFHAMFEGLTVGSHRRPLAVQEWQYRLPARGACPNTIRMGFFLSCH